MAQIESVTTPLVIKFSDGNERVVAACFPHPKGLLYLDLFWHHSTPDQAAHLLPGTLSGEGPWRIGDNLIRVLGCHHTDPALQLQYLPWKEYLESHPSDYPERDQIHDIARRLGCTEKS